MGASKASSRHIVIENLIHDFMLRKFRAPRLAHKRTPDSLGLYSEVVRIPAADGGFLFGWWIPAPLNAPATRAPTAIVLHGWGANASLMLGIAPWVQQLGFHGLFIDARCHGLSSDADFTSMPRFAEDLESARAWALARTNVDSRQLVAIGHSVGAGAVLLSASRISWAGVISLSAFAHPGNMMQRFMDEHHLPRRFIQPWIMTQVQRIIGASFDDIAPENTLPNITCPVMLIHGAEDRDVPLAEAQRLILKAPSGTRHIIIEGVGHDLRPALPELAADAIAFMRTLLR